MKLVKFDGEKTGLVIDLPSGQQIIDIAVSLNALSSVDPVSLEALRRIFDGGANWSTLIEQWGCAGSGLRQLEFLGQASLPERGVVLLPYDQARIAAPSTAPGEIATLEIVEWPKTAQNPTGWDAMPHQFSIAAHDPTH
jgi:hypothetical protein